ncbi:MAG: hypothetical protein N2383_14460, partial [Caldilineales bacterium]|nr:hypothetical protein [Caldilineales bacterium]
FYERLPRVSGFGVEATADQVGLGIVAGVAAAFAAHGIASYVRARKQPLATHEPEGPPVETE